MSDDKKKAVLYGAIGALIIIIFLLFFTNRGRTIINNIMSDAGLGDYSLSPVTINIPGLSVPNLSSYMPVSSCGCGCSGDLNFGEKRPAPVLKDYTQTAPATFQTSRPLPTPRGGMGGGFSSSLTVGYAAPQQGISQSPGAWAF